MSDKFMSKKSTGLGALLLSVSILILFLSFGLPLILKQTISTTELILKALISILVIGLFIWCWTNTFYRINKTRLDAICGPFRFHVKIQDIKEVTTNQKTIGGIIRPTLSWNCIVIEYADFRTLSISPENQDEFINTLKEINNQIKINYLA